MNYIILTVITEFKDLEIADSHVYAIECQKRCRTRHGYSRLLLRSNAWLIYRMAPLQKTLSDVQSHFVYLLHTCVTSINRKSQYFLEWTSRKSHTLTVIFTARASAVNGRYCVNSSHPAAYHVH